MKVLVIQGQGLDVRGKTQVEIFGPETLDEINACIEQDAARYNLTVEIFQSNDATEVIARLSASNGADAIVINPGGFTIADGPLPEALSKLEIPVYEVHASNPAARGVRSKVQPACKGAVCGFGYAGYGMVFRQLAGSG